MGTYRNVRADTRALGFFRAQRTTVLSSRCRYTTTRAAFKISRCQNATRAVFRGPLPV